MIRGILIAVWVAGARLLVGGVMVVVVSVCEVFVAVSVCEVFVAVSVGEVFGCVVKMSSARVLVAALVVAVVGAAASLGDFFTAAVGQE